MFGARYDYVTRYPSFEYRCILTQSFKKEIWVAIEWFTWKGGRITSKFAAHRLYDPVITRMESKYTDFQWRIRYRRKYVSRAPYSRLIYRHGIKLGVIPSLIKRWRSQYSWENTTSLGVNNKFPLFCSLKIAARIFQTRIFFPTICMCADTFSEFTLQNYKAGKNSGEFLEQFWTTRLTIANQFRIGENLRAEESLEEFIF